MNFLQATVMLLMGLIVLIIFLPISSEIIGSMNGLFSVATMGLLSVMVLVIVIAVFINYLQNMQTGDLGDYRSKL